MAHQDIIKMLEQEWRDRLEAAVKQEREACAKVCESKMTGINPLGDDYREECAEAIRARGETTSRGEA